MFVFNDKDEVLMQLRTDYNQYGFPGGAMELGESFEEVARRELKEGTNLDIIDLEMVKVLSGKDTYREYPNGDKLYDITAINMTEHTKNYLEKNGDILGRALKIYKGVNK